MPKIREYTNTQTINTGSLEGAAASAEQSGYYQGKAIEGGFNDLAQGVGEFGDAYGKSRAADLSTKITQIDTDATVAYEQAKQNGDLDKPDFVNKFVEDHISSKLEGLQDGMETKQEQDLFRSASTQMRAEYTKRGFADQINYAGEKAVQNWSDTNAAAVNIVTMDPTLAAHQTDMAKIAVSALPLSPVDRDKLLEKRTQAIYGASMNGYIQKLVKNPNATPQDADNLKAFFSDPKNGFDKNADPETFQAAFNALDRVKDTATSTQFEIAKLQWPKYMTAVKEGNPDANAAAEQFANSYVGATLHDTELGRAQLKTELQDARDFNTATQTYRNMPQPQIDAQYNDLKTKAQAGDKNAAAVITAVDTRNIAFNRDPAAFAISNSPAVAAAAQAATKNPSPQTFQAYATTAAGEQARLYPDRIPKVLTVDMKANIQQQFATMDQTPNGAAAAGELLSKLRDQSGSYYNNVIHELEAEHIISPAQFAAGQLIGRPESQALAQEILRASAIPGKDLWTTSGIPEGVAQKAMTKALQPLMATFSETTNGHELVSSYVQAGALLLRARGVQPGQDINALAIPLANTMVMDRFNIRNNLRIPKELDDADVAHGADNVMANIDKHSIVPPPSFSGFSNGLQHDAYVADLKDYGHWITNAKGDGAQLRDQFNQPVYEKHNGQTVPVEIPYEALQGIGRSNRGIIDNTRRFFTNPGSLKNGRVSDIPNANDIAAAPL